VRFGFSFLKPLIVDFSSFGWGMVLVVMEALRWSPACRAQDIDGLKGAAGQVVQLWEVGILWKFIQSFLSSWPFLWPRIAKVRCVCVSPASSAGVDQKIVSLGFTGGDIFLFLVSHATVLPTAYVRTLLSPKRKVSLFSAYCAKFLGGSRENCHRPYF
jgi:hypothetical protein